MRPMILEPDPTAWYYTKERCDINELANLAADPAVSIAEARVAPGVTTRWHRLRDITERYVILAGTGKVEVGELPAQFVTAATVVVIPPGCRQRITNVGPDQLIFLAICSPRFVQSAYEDAEAASVSE